MICISDEVLTSDDTDDDQGTDPNYEPDRDLQATDHPDLEEFDEADSHPAISDLIRIISQLNKSLKLLNKRVDHQSTIVLSSVCETISISST